VDAYEPSPHAFRLLKENTRPIRNIRCHNVGLLNETRTATMYHGGFGTVMDSLYDIGQMNMSTFSVQLQDVREIEIQADVLKVDTEGAEYPILKSLAQVGKLAGTRIIYVEYHREEDRRKIDTLLHKTHYITTGQLFFPTQGELMYVSREIPQEKAVVMVGLHEEMNQSCGKVSDR